MCPTTSIGLSKTAATSEEDMPPGGSGKNTIKYKCPSEKSQRLIWPAKGRLFQPGTGESPPPPARQTDGDTVPSAGHLQPPAQCIRTRSQGIHTSFPWRSSLRETTAQAEPVSASSEQGKPACSTKPGLGGLEPIKRTAANPRCEGALGTLGPARCTPPSTSTCYLEVAVCAG